MYIVYNLITYFQQRAMKRQKTCTVGLETVKTGGEKKSCASCINILGRVFLLARSLGPDLEQSDRIKC